MNVMGIMQQIMSNNRVMGNPMIQNAMSMAQSGNGKGIEQMARNLCKEKGITKFLKILSRIFDTPRTFGFFNFKNPFAKFYKNLSRTCKELEPHFN